MHAAAAHLRHERGAVAELDRGVRRKHRQQPVAALVAAALAAQADRAQHVTQVLHLQGWQWQGWNGV